MSTEPPAGNTPENPSPWTAPADPGVTPPAGAPAAPSAPAGGTPPPPEAPASAPQPPAQPMYPPNGAAPTQPMYPPSGGAPGQPMYPPSGGAPGQPPTGGQPAYPPTAPGGTPPTKPKSGLALSALIVGIAAIVFALIPFVSFFAFLPALAAITLGIIALVTKKPRRGWSITGLALGAAALVIAIVVSVVTVGVISSNILDSQSTSSPAPIAPTEEAEEPAPSQAPELSEDGVYEGTGDAIFDIELVDGEGSAVVAEITHSGDGSFAVYSLDANQEQLELVVSTFGDYEGRVLFNNLVGEDVTALEVIADGDWTVEIVPGSTVPEEAGPSVSGDGDDVFVYTGAGGTAEFTHDGESNIIVSSFGPDGSELLVNEIGEFTGSVPLAAGPIVISVIADGNWSMTVG